MTRRSAQDGFALIGFLILSMIGALLIASALELARSDARTDRAIKERPAVFYSVEDGLGRSLTWLRSSSNEMAPLFGRDRFYAAFRRAAPGNGANDALSLVPSKLRLVDTKDAPILSTSELLGRSAFPDSRDGASRSVFNPIKSFVSTDLGDSLVRITLVDAVPIDPAKDFGPPPARAPETDFSPIYRLDVMTAVDRGAHIYAIVTGEPGASASAGILSGEDILIEGECDSYRSSVGRHGGSNRSAGCALMAKRDLTIASRGTVFGSATAKGRLNVEGRLCGDSRSCKTPGQRCSGSGCSVPDLPPHAEWSAACPRSRGDLRVTGNLTLVPASAAPEHRCWNEVRIARNARLTLTSSSIPYHFESLSFEDGQRSELRIAPSAGAVELHVWSTPDSLWDARSFDLPEVPSAFSLHYQGTSPLVLERATFVGRIFSLHAPVSLERNIDFSGSITALGLTVGRQARLHLDEDSGGGLGGMRHRLRQVVQAYR